MDNLRGALLMVLAMTGFALEDAIIKMIGGTMPTGQIIALIGCGGAIPAATYVIWREGLPRKSAILNPIVLIRGLFEIIAVVGFITALGLIPLAALSAIIQAVPLAVTLGAAVFFGESVGWRRWSAILVGFIGVLIIIRPGAASFDPNSLFGVLAIVGLAGRDLATKAIHKNISTNLLTLLAFVNAGLAGLLMIPFGGSIQTVSLETAGYLIVAIIMTFAATWAIIAAMRIGEVSFVAPFRYSRLIIAIFIGTVVFDEFPDTMTILGAIVVVLSGIYTFTRERQISHAKR